MRGPPSWFETARALNIRSISGYLEGRAPPHHEGGSQTGHYIMNHFT
jgi:hypothetical protein